jgi:hypothetical protein
MSSLSVLILIILLLTFLTSAEPSVVHFLNLHWNARNRPHRKYCRPEKCAVGTNFHLQISIFYMSINLALTRKMCMQPFRTAEFYDAMTWIFSSFNFSVLNSWFVAETIFTTHNYFLL